MRFRFSPFLLAAALILAAMPARADEFAAFLQSLRPEAEAAGVSRATFDRETRGLKPDLGLPDLVLPGRPATGAPSQPEFVQLPPAYVKEASIARLAGEGRKLKATWREPLERISARFGVPAAMVLAIWGRETDFGRSSDKLDALTVVATQAWVGRRKSQYRREFIDALKILDEGAVARKDFRASWAGATGLTQFLPSEYFQHGVALDGKGHADIWHSVPDALASAAKQLVDKGWQPGLDWAYEVTPPANFDCTMAVPDVRKPLRDWIRADVRTLQGGVPPTAADEPASLLQPEGLYGPSFLVTKNYFVIKQYNFSDLYVLYVGHLADEIDGGRPFVTPWGADAQLRTAAVEVMQRGLTAAGFYHDKIDGKAGMLTRSAVGAYQKSAGLKVDCWPSETVLQALSAH